MKDYLPTFVADQNTFSDKNLLPLSEKCFKKESNQKSLISFCEDLLQNVYKDETPFDTQRFKLEKTFFNFLFGGHDDQHLFDLSFKSIGDDREELESQSRMGFNAATFKF